MQIAASLTFTTLFALVPLVTVALTMISAFPAFGDMNLVLQQFVVENLMPETAEAIGSYMEQFRINAAKLTVLGLSFLVATAVMLLLTIEHAFNQIWRVRRQREIVRRVIIYGTLLTVGPVLVGVSLSLSSWLISRSLGMVGDVPGASPALLRIVPMALTSLALALLYLVMPNRRIALRDALLGSVVAGLVFEATRRGFAWYLIQFPTYQLVYGAFAAAPIFLLWIYISWLIVVLGAVVVAALPEWRTRAMHGRAPPGADFADALRILKVLWEAWPTGEAVLLARLHESVKTRVERIEALLETMSAAGWTSRAGRSRWALACDPRTITLEQVYRLFVFRVEASAAPREGDGELDPLLRGISARIASELQMSLEELFAPPQTVSPVIPARVQAL